jgi:hypothetical protein
LFFFRLKGLSKTEKAVSVLAVARVVLSKITVIKSKLRGCEKQPL